MSMTALRPASALYQLLRHLFFSILVVFVVDASSGSPASADAPLFARLCHPQNGCVEWTITKLHFEGEEGRICKTIADTRCHPCWNESGKRMCAPIVGNAAIRGIRVSQTGGRDEVAGRNAFYVRCTGEASPEVIPQSTNEPYSLDKRMFNASFSPPGMLVYYNLWWAVCRDQNQKYEEKLFFADAATPQTKNAGASISGTAKVTSEKKANSTVSAITPPSINKGNTSPTGKNVKEKKQYYSLYQQYLTLKICEQKSNGEVRLDALRESMKKLDQMARGQGFDPDVLFEEAKEAPADEMQKILMATATMLPMLSGSERMQVILTCRRLAASQSHIIDEVVSAGSQSGSNPDDFMKKDF